MDKLIESNKVDHSINHFVKKDKQVNVIIKKKKIRMELAKYLYATYLYPLISTFTKAIANNNFSSWPGLTPKLILKYLPKSIYTY